MPLPNINYGAGQDSMEDVFDKTNSGLDEAGKQLVSSNDSTYGYLNGKLVAGDNITLTENNDGGNETLTIDFVTKDANYNNWSGTQALTGSYALVGDLTYTTPNDGITRYYDIVACAAVAFGASLGTDQDMFLKIRNTSASTDLSEELNLLITTPDAVYYVLSFQQGVCIYSGSIAPNTTIQLQAKKTSGSSNLKTGSFKIIEVYR